MSKIINYFKNVKVELSKVSWPTKKEALRLTFVVIGLSLVFALFIGSLDILFMNIIRMIVSNGG